MKIFHGAALDHLLSNIVLIEPLREFSYKTILEEKN